MKVTFVVSVLVAVITGALGLIGVGDGGDGRTQPVARSGPSVVGTQVGTPPPPTLPEASAPQTPPGAPVEPSVEAPVQETAPPAPGPQTTTRPVVSSARSDAWWSAISVCESGDQDGWRTGYYGIEAGYAIGGMSKADQLNWAKGIYANYGDRAWGCSPVAWGMVPEG